MKKKVLHGRVGYSYEVKGSEDNVKQRRYNPHEALGSYPKKCRKRYEQG